MIIVGTDNGPVEVDAQPTATKLRTRPPRLDVEWRGTDGQSWPLTRAGQVKLMPGARGFGYPTPQHRRRESLSHGSSHHGLRIPQRQVYMPVGILTTPGEFLDVDRAFGAGFDPYSTGRLRVTTADAEWREIECRYDEGFEGEYEFSPLFNGVAIYQIYLTAEDPFWRGAPVVEYYPFVADTGGPTFPGPPFYRPPANKLDGEGQIVNPGDVEAHAVERIDAPFTGFDVGIGDQFVSMTLTKATGFVVVDTTGGMTTMTDETGANVRKYATNFQSPPIPPGETTLKLNVRNPGPGSAVTISFEPRFYRAW